MRVPFLLLVISMLCFSSAESLAESCQTNDCHSSISNLLHQHPPAADGECLACHVETEAEHPIKGAKSFELVEQGSALCYQCHDEMENKQVIHDPVSEGDCLACHNPHGATNQYLLNVGTDQANLCFDCHDNEPFELQFKHGPAAVGACTLCHSPHESKHQSLLQSEIRALCLKCHQDFADQMEGSPVVHPPVKDGPCTDCHNPHADISPFMLKKKIPDLCFDCHAEVGEKLTNSTHKHKPIEEAGSCGSCHSTHFSQSKGLLAIDEKSLCLGCHGVDNLGDPPLKNIKKQLEGKRNLHGPLLQGECVPCHDPHSSDFFRLLKGSYPENIYAPYQAGIYDFCLNCHDKNLLKFEETSMYTSFRNGNRNLHFVHVVNKRKGRTCRICHATHASDDQKLVNAKGSPFGDWSLPINFKSTETGGRCSPGCHRPFEYDRVKPLEYN
jgi:predicted CXXCH cytochrome family protein